jgi:branched-chain amino acid transport system substrate-binding protein
MKVLGRDQLNPKEADYKTSLTKIKGLNPDAIYYGGVQQPRPSWRGRPTRSRRRSTSWVPTASTTCHSPSSRAKGSGRGLVRDQRLPGDAVDPKAQEWVNKFKSKFKRDPTNYSITSYNGVVVIADAVGRVAKSGKPMTRSSVRDAIQATSLKNTLQGPIEYDDNGDIKRKVISVYQVKDGKFVYIGVAPEK